VAEVPLELLPHVRGDPEGPDVEDLSVEERLRVLLYVADHLLDQVLRLPASRPNEDPVAPMDVGEGVIRGDELVWEAFFPFF